MLSVNKVSAYYGSLRAVDHISIRVDHGEIVAVLGANGAGKSTLLKSISGVVRVRTGSIVFKDRDIHKLPSHKVVSLGIAQVPEGRMLFAPLTVHENLRLGTFSAKSKMTRVDIEDAFKLVYELFPILRDRQNQKVGTMSGGQQQMVAIGRALMSKPELLILDEPSWGLAPLIIDDIFRVLGKLNKEQGLSILIAEQNIEQVLSLAGRAYVMETGRIAVEGSSEELLVRNDLKDIYLGKGSHLSGAPTGAV